MTVKELIKELSCVREDAIVLLASDAEGNSINPLVDIDEPCDTDWTGSSENPASIPLLWDGEDFVEDKGEFCIVLYPMG